MRWQRRDWRPYQPKPKAEKLDRSRLACLAATASRFVLRSRVLSGLGVKVEVARGRLYFWRGDADCMARITPLSLSTYLLEAPGWAKWREGARGTFRIALNALERDRYSVFHGLGALAGRRKRSATSVQESLLRDFGMPIEVVAEPREWYAKRRTPRILEADRERVLVEFTAIGPFGSFGGRGLYARRDGVWGFYAIRPREAASIARAEAWLEKRDWQGWTT